MPKMRFHASPEPTLGVEIELALVHAETMALESAMPRLSQAIPEQYRSWVKPELMQCCLEVNTAICRSVGEAEKDLAKKLALVETTAASLGLRLLWSGTHPFSHWKDQQPTDNERYALLLNNLQEMGRRLVTFGLHAHVGVDSGDKAVMICERLMRHLPTLLALSCNSPFWHGRDTGVQSFRSKVVDGLPTAGMPTLMRNWSEYVWLVHHLQETGFITSIRDIWWDVRPHHNFGTVEVRICDVPGCLSDAMAIVAVIHSLVVALSEEIDRGTYQRDFHPMMVNQNKWRAARYGLDAQLVDLDNFQRHPAREVVLRLLDRIHPAATQIGCAEYLDRAAKMAQGPTGADRQLEIWQETKDPTEVGRRLLTRPSR